MSDIQNSDENAVNATKEQISSWEQGWYVFENGQVLGPLNAEEAFAAETSASTGNARMVSRKGFTQWYPVRDFAEIYAMIGNYSEQLNRPAVSPQKNTSDFEPKSKVIGTNVNSTLNLASVETETTLDCETNKKQTQAESTNIESNTISATTATRNDENDVETPKITSRQAKAARAAAKSQNLMDQGLFAQHYLAVQSRLRLGRVFSPVVGAFIYTPLTLGGYWWDWFARASEEVSWHVTGSSKVNFVLPVWACMIPGLHLVMAYFLARMVSHMEIQNGYRSANPWLATLAAIFPPFYIVMIQSALNKHWRLHVYHSAMPR